MCNTGGFSLKITRIKNITHLFPLILVDDIKRYFLIVMKKTLSSEKNLFVKEMKIMRI